MKKLIYLDSYNICNDHEVFNSSSLLMFSYLYDEITYYACKSSHEAVYNLINLVPQNVHYKSILVINPKSRILSFLHHFFAAITNIYFTISSKRSILIINTNNLWDLPIINYLLRKLNRKVVVICHGELEYLVNGKKLNRVSNSVLRWMQNDRTKISKGLYFCVLGNSILENVREILPENIAKHFISINHTIISNHIETEKRNARNYKIGAIGTAHENKGLKEILEFGEKIEPHKEFEFYTLGRVLCSPNILIEKGIKYISGSEYGFVDRETLISYIQQMDVIVFLHASNSYKFTASGALMDAIDCEKLILSLHNDYFDNVFERVNYGKLFNNIDDIISFLLKYEFLNHSIDYKQNKKILSPAMESYECKDMLKKNYIL